MTTALLLFDCIGGRTPDAVSTNARLELLRGSLNALWSEDPGDTADIIVQSDPAGAAVARREHGNRVRVMERRVDSSPAEALNTLMDSTRHRFLVLLEPGISPTPGWLRELRRVAEQDGMLVGPCLPLGAAEGLQAEVVPQRPSRNELRRAATSLRFREPRCESVDALAPPCILFPRETLNRIGSFDARYESLKGVLMDFQRRIRSQGGRLLLARRSLVGALPAASLPAVDREALGRRETFFAALGEGCPPVAIEFEADDAAAERLRELANGLVERGVPLCTFSRRDCPSQRPSRAPHVHASLLETAAKGAALVLLRSEGTALRRALLLEFTGVTGAGATSERILRLEEGGEGDVRRTELLDKWVLAICSAALAAAEDERS